MTARSLVEQAANRELAVLTDGPFRLRWFWRDELEAMRRSAERHVDDHPAARMRHYQPTDRFEDHPLEAGVRGRVWTYRYSADARAAA